MYQFIILEDIHMVQISSNYIIIGYVMIEGSRFNIALGKL